MQTGTAGKYILYGGKPTRALMVEMVMAEIGLDYELRPIDISRREQLSPAFLEINPAGWIPALITPEGERLYETAAINLYLAEHHGADHLAPVIDDPDRGVFLSGLFYLTGELEHALKRYFYPHRYGDGEQDAAAVKSRAAEACVTCFEVINDRLAQNGPYHLGERFSLIDLVTAYWALSFEEPGRIADLQNVHRCAALVAERPQLKPHFDTLQSWMREFFEGNNI